MSSNGVIEIGKVRGEPGQISRGYIDIGQTVSGPIRIPIVIVNGANAGPVVCLTAGVHATEYAPIEAVMRLVNEIRPEDLKGTVIGVPIVNMHMFSSRLGFVSPIDGLNLNKIAPGGDGSISEILAQVLLQEVISRAQYHIDLHAGDLGEALWPFAGYALAGRAEQDEESEALARLYTPRLISASHDGVALPPFKGSLVYEASRSGIISILAEAGGNGTLHESDVQVHLRGVRNVLRYLGMIDGTPSLASSLLVANGRSVTRAKTAGLLKLTATTGDFIAEGQEVAEVWGVFGQVVEHIRVERAGIAGLIWTHKAVNTGDPVIRCWYTEPASSLSRTDQFTVAKA